MPQKVTHKGTTRLLLDSRRYFDTCLMHNIGGISDRQHDSLSVYYVDKESCHHLSEIPPILCIKHVKISVCGELHGLIVCSVLWALDAF